jgi:hypothetical protein
MGLSLFVRPSNLILTIPLAIGGTRNESKREVVRSIMGLSLILVAWGAVNGILWGSPLHTSYSRLPLFIAGSEHIQGHPLGFNVEVLLSDWRNKLFSDHGLLPFNLSILALPWVVASMIKKFDRFKLVCLSTALVYTGYIFSYPMWSSSINGNRFLLPAIHLYLIFFIPLLGRMGCSLRDIKYFGR